MLARVVGVAVGNRLAVDWQQHKWQLFLLLFKEKLFWHKWSALQSVAVKRSTDNDVSGHYFCRYSFPPTFFSSQSRPFLRRNARIKKPIEQKLFRAANNIGVDPFPDPVGHFGPPGIHFGLCRTRPTTTPSGNGIGTNHQPGIGISMVVSVKQYHQPTYPTPNPPDHQPDRPPYLSLISTVSQPYLNRISALFQLYCRCISAISKAYFRHISDVFQLQLYLGCISAISQPYLSQISAVSQLYLNRISNVSQPYLSHISAVSQPYLNSFSIVSQPYLSRIQAVSQPYVNCISAISQPYLGRILAISQPYLSSISAFSQPYLSCIAAVSQPYLIRFSAVS